MLQKIKIQNILIHSNHGCMDEEAKIGSDYTVNLTIWANLLSSAQTDDLADTVDYVHLNQIVHNEMYQRAKLLETVAQRILNKIKLELPQIQRAKVEIAKLNPPMGGNVESVSVIFQEEFKKETSLPTRDKDENSNT